MKFILNKKKVIEQYNILKNLGIKISYSFKTNREVGKILEETDSDFSIHNIEEIGMIKNKSKIWFFPQAWNIKEIKEILDKGVRNFVIDNEKDLEVLLSILDIKINLILRMRFMENTIVSGKYFVYGMSSDKINEIIPKLRENKFINKLGIHIHRKTQNTSEWRIKEELQDSLSEENLNKIDVVNFGGGLPVEYISYTSKVLPSIFDRIKEAVQWLKEKNIESYIEPGRFICGPAIKLETEIIQIYDNNIIINVSIYNCALDTVITHTKLLVEGEGEGKDYLIKGNSPTRDDIFRYRVKLKNIKVGDKIIFLNAGAYNYTTDFCGFKKLKTEIINE